MPTIDSITRKSGINSEKSNIPEAQKAKTGAETHEAASLAGDSKELLLRAQKNALEAKEAALGAINRFYKESQESDKKPDKMVSELGEAIQLALRANKKTHGIDEKETGQDQGRSITLPHNEKNPKISKKILNAGYNRFGIVSDLKKSLSGNRPADEEVKEEFYRLDMRQNPQLRQLIDDLTEDKARIKTEKIMAEAKSEVDAARVAVYKAQEEIYAAKVEAKRAFLEAGNAQKAAELIVSQVKQVAISEAANEITRAHEEVKAVKEAANTAIRRAEEEINIARQETLEAQKEAERAKQTQKEAERAKQTMLEIISQSQEESRKARDEAEVSILKANEAIIQAKKDIINITRDEIVKVRQELESPHKTRESGEAKGEQPESRKVDSDYVATVLHEMRTPLHSISGFAKLMLEENVSDDTTRKEFLSIMVQQSESLNKLIDDLSHILNDKSEAFSINKEPVSSYKIVTEAIDSVQEMAQQKKNLISHNLNPSLPEIEADAFRIKQVIINLLTNAIKFSPENRPIFVKAGVQGKELLVQVIDYGSGIPKDEIPAIFNKYYQAENRSNVEGTGLGLYICQQIVKAHGGRIWAESVEGEGSTFSFSLPIATARQ